MKVPSNTHEYCSRTNPQKISCQNDTRLYDKGTNWLLRFFPSLRAEVDRLREAVAQLTQEKLRMQDRLDTATEDRARLWDMTFRCLDGERTAYQMHINQSWQRQGGGAPYPDVPHLMPSAMERTPGGSVGRQGRRLPSEAVGMKTNDFIDSLLRKS